MSNKYHFIKDESLGGIERKFVEVDRKAAEGDKIIVEDAYETGGYYDNGDIHTVSGRYNYGAFMKGVIIDIPKKANIHIRDTEYRTLEPTDIVIIDGKEFRLVERKARVGEKVLIKMNADSTYEGNHGKIFDVLEEFGNLNIVDLSGYHIDGSRLNAFTWDYYVLESVNNVLIEEKLMDALSHLAVEVAEIKQKLNEIQTKAIEGNLVKMAVTYEYERE